MGVVSGGQGAPDARRCTNTNTGETGLSAANPDSILLVQACRSPYFSDFLGSQSPLCGVQSGINEAGIAELSQLTFLGLVYNSCAR